MRRGFSIVEVMVAAGLFLILMTLAWGGFSVLNRGGEGLRASSEPRQQLRVLLANLQNDLRMASYIYPADTYTILGQNLTTPATGGIARALVFAVPENSLPPLTFKVCTVFARPRQPADANNPSAHEVVYYTVEGVDPPTSDFPSEIDPNLLPPSGSQRVFDAYLDGPNALQLTLSDDGNAVIFHVDFKRTPPRGEVQQDQLETAITMRNNR